ncbi:MAG: PHP domain-containing protein [Chloroflexi bacterium]|nr:PHP domain-containing protein [Chloroflexota bacterium]
MASALVLRGDFHMHTWYSKDCGTRPAALVKRALKVGLTCIAVTDHNTIKGGLEVQKIAPPGLKVIVAEEVKTPYGEITGFFLKEEVPKGLSPEETCKRIKAQGGLVSIPHPYDRVRRYVLQPEVVEAIMPYIDIVEVFNARTTFLRDSDAARAFAEKHGFAKGAGSDAHCTLELGHVFVEMPPFDGAQGFKESLRAAKIKARRSSPLYHSVSTFTKIRKRVLLWGSGR